MNGVREHIMLEPYKGMTDPSIEDSKDSNSFPKNDILHSHFEAMIA